MKCVVLFSGGVDSLSSLIWAVEKFGKENVLALYCYLWHRYVKKEVIAVREICTKLGIPFIITTVSRLDEFEKEDAHIPYRNLFLVATASLYLPEEGGTIVIQNVQVGETSVGDRTIRFNEAMEKVLNIAEKKKVKVISPFKDYTKGEMVSWLKRQGMNSEIVKLTIGCFSREDGNCGNCPACFRRWIALENAGYINDVNSEWKEWFNSNPLESEVTKEYVEKFKQGKYEKRRTEESKRILMKYGVW